VRYALTLALAATTIAATPALAKDKNAERPDEVVLLRKLPKDGEGAPSAQNANRLVVLSAVDEVDRYFAVVQLLLDRGAAEVIPFDPAKPKGAFKSLTELRPGFVAIVIRPEDLDVNVHFDLLERAARLDADPFMDFAFGYFTGATAEEALTFAKATGEVARTKPAKTILEFGPSTKPVPMTRPVAHTWAKGFKTRRLAHPNDAGNVAQLLGDAKDCGILSAWGHGMPDGVVDGLSGASLRASGLDLFPAVYFSGPCYCGVPSRWFDTSTGAVREKRTAPEDSFLLALLKARVSAAFAGLDPDRGETSEHELEHVLATGEPLGMASKATYDECVLAYRRGELILPRYARGRGRPYRDIHDEMISGGACRALFGDPTSRPFEKAGDDPFPVTLTETKKGLEVVWKRSGRIGNYWAPVDVYRARGGWTHRIRFRFELPLERANGLKRFRVLSVTKDGKDLDYEWPTAALEVWGGRLRVHGMIVFPRDDKDRALWNGQEFEARFLFRK
jgi:hypothetical protein